MTQTVNPASLRFTQEAISCHFKKPHEHFGVREALAKIQAGRMSPGVFPKLRVMSYNGLWWSVDNRRLWVFRMANCSEISVKVMTAMHPRLDAVISVPSRLKRLSKAAFLPRVREGQSIQALPKDLHPRVAEVMARISRSGFSEGVPAAIPKSLPPPTAVSIEYRHVVKGVRRPGSNKQVIQFGSVEPNTLGVERESSVTATSIKAGSVMEPELLPVVPDIASDGISPGGIASAQPSREPYPRSVREISGTTHAEQCHLSVARIAQAKVAERSHLNIGLTQSEAAERRHLTDQVTFVRSGLLLRGCIDDDELPTESGLGWLRRLVFGCFGYG